MLLSVPVIAAMTARLLLGPPTSAGDLSLEDRVHAQEAIERVYWEHRIWPPENGTPKPALEDVLTPAQIQDEVEDYLRKSNALATLWNQPITSGQLQDEMRRMAAETLQPAVLAELFAALGNDPRLIAETLVRQTLADRLIREAYAQGLPSAGESPTMSFDAWWADAAAGVGDTVEPLSGALEAVEISAAPSCAPDTWKDLPAGPAPFIGHQAVWTGSEMIVWGQYSTGYPASGGRYNPATNTWTATSDLNAPARRNEHTAVWTGREMIVWGGVTFDTGLPLNDGGRYDPITDTWRATSTSNAPVKRDLHTAVWTGSVMMVWGGQGGATGVAIFNDGGRYNPLSDTWTAITTTGAPPARAQHTAVWTGTQMLVWGGFNNTSIPRAGGRYDPATNTWTPMSALGEPTPRYLHTAVWTGSRMIVWGGESGFFNTGGLYDPVVDTWVPTSMAGQVPAGRSSHSAVWTGHEMIIWGGHQGGSTFDGGGGRYNPDKDTWISVSSAEAPTDLPGRTAVWTGQEMLVWGGTGGTTAGYSGRYCTSPCDVEKTFYRDADGDGYGNPQAPLAFCAPGTGYVDDATDCNDSSSAIHPGATEVCNQVDDNCDGRIDDLGSTTCGTGACRRTVDNCVAGILQTCVPGNPTAEVCNAIDDDCNGLVDDGLGVGTVNVIARPGVLWPPNHRMVDVHVTTTVTGGCPTACPAPPTVVLGAVSSSEPDDAIGGGDGSTVGDIQDAAVGTADFDVQLRAERASAGSGRLYALSYTATDCFGATAAGQAGVLVPHDQDGEADPISIVVGNGERGSWLEWGAAPGAVSYRVIRGALGLIRDVGGFVDLGAVTCLQADVSATSTAGHEDIESPAPGQGFFYLVAYSDATGPSGYGSADADKPRVPGSGDCP